MQGTNVRSPLNSAPALLLALAAFVAALVTGTILICVGNVSAGEAATLVTVCTTVLAGGGAVVRQR